MAPELEARLVHSDPSCASQLLQPCPFGVSEVLPDHLSTWQDAEVSSLCLGLSLSCNSLPML